LSKAIWKDAALYIISQLTTLRYRIFCRICWKRFWRYVDGRSCWLFVTWVSKWELVAVYGNLTKKTSDFLEGRLYV
jgi:hypothetical protein